MTPDEQEAFDTLGDARTAVCTAARLLGNHMVTESYLQQANRDIYHAQMALVRQARSTE